MLNVFKKDPYGRLIDFPSSVIESEELITWLRNLELITDQQRMLELTGIKEQMAGNKEPEEFIQVFE